MPKAVLLINLGTPDSHSSGAVRAYLRQFLSDPRVIDIPALFRWLLLNLVILPFRPAKSAAAYSKIWTPEGSPLLTNTKRFTRKLSERIGEGVIVDFAMRYGNPSIESVVNKMLSEPVEELIILPLYPQYSSSATASSVEEVFNILKKRANIPPIKVLGAFYCDAGYVNAVAETARQLISGQSWDCFLFSYHGLPERHVVKSEGRPGFCLAENDTCCAAPCAANQYCYRAQCFATTRRVASALGLPMDKCKTSFQSRLGRTPWIKPFTDELFQQLPQQGIKNLLVFSPSFVADCLETLEEIAMRGSETFIAAGGEKLELVPSLNSTESWVDAVAAMVQNHL